MARSTTASATDGLRHILVTALFVAAALFIGATTVKADGLDDKQKSEVEAMIRDYILEHPEVVIEAIQKYQENERVAQQQKSAQALASLASVFEEEGAFPRSGNKDGDVLFVEFFDYQCGYCKKVFPDMMAIADNDKDLNVVYVEFPILSEQSVTASRAALASEKQGKYMDMHKALMGHRGSLSDDVIMKIAASVGLDVDRLRADMGSDEITAKIQRNRELASALGLRGTPAFVIGDNLAPGAISKDQMLDLIKQARANG